MTKRYKVVFTLISVGQFLATGSATIAHYYTKTRMGMQRHMIYLNRKWENALPLESIKWITLLFLVALLLEFLLRWKNYKGPLSAKIIMIVLSIVCFYWLLFLSTGINKAYYIITPLLILTTILQHIRIRI